MHISAVDFNKCVELKVHSIIVGGEYPLNDAIPIITFNVLVGQIFAQQINTKIVVE